MITVRSTINIATQASPPVIPVVQGDSGRSIIFSLADFIIPEGALARYFVMKPSGLAVYNDATIDGNTVLVDLTAQSIAEVGDSEGQVRISLNDEVVTSFDFILHVVPFRGIDAIQTEAELNIFDEAVARVEAKIDTDIKDEIALAAATAAAEVISIATGAAQTATTKAGEASASATTATNKAGEASSSATAAANSAADAAASAAQIGDYCLWFKDQVVAATTGDILTISNAKITANHIVAECVWGDPSAITSDVTCTTSAGSLVLNGTCETATTATILLVYKTN